MACFLISEGREGHPFAKNPSLLGNPRPSPLTLDFKTQNPKPSKRNLMCLRKSAVGMGARGVWSWDPGQRLRVSGAGLGRVWV